MYFDFGTPELVFVIVAPKRRLRPEFKGARADKTERRERHSRVGPVNPDIDYSFDDGYHAELPCALDALSPSKSWSDLDDDGWFDAVAGFDPMIAYGHAFVPADDSVGTVSLKVLRSDNKHTKRKARRSKYWDSLTDEQRAAMVERMKEGHRASPVTPGRAERISKARRAEWAKLTPEERLERSAKFREAGREANRRRWEAMSEDERSAQMARMRERADSTGGRARWWASLTQEERDAFMQKMRNARGKKKAASN